MKRLLLLRHGKASRAEGSDDHARPLADHGIRTAEAMAEHCANRLRPVDIVLCSSATRARETLRRLERFLPPSCKIVVDDALYRANPDALLAALRGIDESCGVALIVGHEPGLSELATRLCERSGRSKSVQRIARGIKAASLLTIELGSDLWSELGPGAGVLRSVVRPKDLRGQTERRNPSRVQ